MDTPYNGGAKRPGSPSPLTSPAHSTASRRGLLQACCGRCYPQRYQVRGRRILVSTNSISEGPPSLSTHSHQSQATAVHDGGRHSPYSLHSQSQLVVDPNNSYYVVPNVAFNVPGEMTEQRRASSTSPYNETRV